MTVLVRLIVATNKWQAVHQFTQALAFRSMQKLANSVDDVVVFTLVLSIQFSSVSRLEPGVRSVNVEEGCLANRIV